MRYYDIVIEGPSGGAGAAASGTGSGSSSGGGQLRYTSHPNGPSSPPDPGALQVEFDCFQLPQGLAEANSWVKIWGIPLSTIGSAANLNNRNISIKAGMGKGLPLANPQQAGQIVGGRIIQAFGNWIGTDMTLDLIMIPGFANATESPEPRNAVVDWKENTPLKEALDQTLQTAYPGLKRDIQISDQLKLPNRETGFYGTLPQLAQYVFNISRKIIGPANYPGVQIVPHGDTIYVRDGTQQSNVKQISFLDLIGQPTWIGVATIQATLVMRGDLKVFDIIKLPPGLLTTRSSSNSPFSTLKQQTAFQGQFSIQKIRHVGNFKQPDGRAWSTIIDCLTNPTGTFDKNDVGPGIGVQTGPGYT